MKSLKLVLILAAAALVVFGLSGMSYAFHEGGVAHCDGCHTMHNSDGGVVVDPTGTIGDAGERMLLTGSDASSTCLHCHIGLGSYHIASDDPTQINESGGGDFYWLQNDYTVDFGWTQRLVSGDNFGHNIIAADYLYTADTTLAAAPGGTYSAGLLGCTSCHDAHGQVAGGTSQGSAPIRESGSYGAVANASGIVGNYRLLGDSVYTAGYTASDGYAFSADAPIAYADNGGWGATHYGQRVDYGSGMSEWCGNCHAGFLAGSSTAHRHPAQNDAHLNGYDTAYNAYHATGDYLVGRADGSYDGMVPIERGITNAALLDPAGTGTATTWGSHTANSSSNVMCLTCHRAHASGNENMGRWDFTTELLDHSWTHSAIAGLTITDLDANMYYNASSIDIATKYGPYQRSLCNKCHVQD